MHISNLKGFFTPEAVALRLKGMAPLKTTVVDTFFARKVNHPFAKVGADDIAEVGAAAPLIMRGAPSLSVSQGPLRLSDYEPYEVSIHKFFTAADVNNLVLLDRTGLEARLAAVDDSLRRICRATAEGIASTALTGTISWPVQLEKGGFETYQVKFGDPFTFTPSKLWDALDAKIREVFGDLQEMETIVQEGGYGGEVKFWAGRKAFAQLLALAEVYGENPKAKLRVEISDKGISIGGFLVAKQAERYKNPETGAMVPKVADHKILAFASDAAHTLFYCAIDDLDGKLAPLPYYSKPVPTSDPSGVKVLGRSKPFPVPIVKAMCWAAVCAEG